MIEEFDIIKHEELEAREQILQREMARSGIRGTEGAQFMAQMSHESGGFRYMEEIASGSDMRDGATLATQVEAMV